MVECVSREQPASGQGARGMWRLLLCCVLGARAARLRELPTGQGRVRGYLAPPAPRTAPHYAYLGLPYAQPPVHHNRYKAPLPPPSWDGIFEAAHRIKCPQPDARGQEDCLVLNVFVPATSAGDPRPVLVMLHGGNFNQGWGAFEPPDAFIEEGFIVVTLNYRLGVLGFLCLGVLDIPGNAGLKDIVAALYWVHRNIHHFGGDIYQVTVYGIEAGAAALQVLILTGLTEGLVQQAILESGSILSPIMMNYDPVATAHKMATKVGHKGDEYADLINFYKTSKVGLLTNISQSRAFVPCIEPQQFPNSLLDTDPLAIYSSRRRHELPMLVVYTDEISNMPHSINVDKFKALPAHFEPLLPNNLCFDDQATEHRIAELIKDFYFEYYAMPEHVVENFGSYINDVIIEYPIVKSTVLHAIRSVKPVYLMKLLGQQSSCCNLVLRYFYNNKRFTEEDNHIGEILSSLWSSFIRVSDPTPLTTTLVHTIWQPVYSSEHGNVHVGNAPTMLLSNEKTVMSQPPAGMRLAFWDKIYNKFYKPYQHIIYTE